MKKIIKLLIFILSFKVNVFSFYSFSFIGYPKQPSILFNHPAAVGLLDRFGVELGYGVILRNLLENNLYTSEIASNFNFKSIFCGVGYNTVVLEDIYSEEIFIFNLGSSFFKRRVILASNIRYYLFKHTYDEYYEEDSLKDTQSTLYNFDFGLLFNLNNFLFSLSGINLYDNKLGKDIKYTLTKKFIFNLSYRYSNNSNISFETQFSEERVAQKNRNLLDYKFGIAQKIFNSKVISCDVLFILIKSKDFTGFCLSLYNKFVKNKLGLKYIWYYPVTGIQNFSGNHYIVLNFEIGEKTPTEEFKKTTAEKEISKEIEKIKVKEEKHTEPKLELNIKLSKEEIDLNKVEISTPSAETNEIKKQTLIPQTTSQQVITVDKKKTEQLPASKEINVSTKTSLSTSKEEIQKEDTTVIPKTEKPSIYQTSYKFPLAHKVREGETLVSISKKYYNTEKGWKKIYEANKDKIIKGVPIVGEVLIIPEP